MTNLLKRAFNKASKLPEIEQNALAKWVLEELETEREWEKTFAESEKILDKFADEALALHRKGKTRTMNIKAL